MHALQKAGAMASVSILASAAGWLTVRFAEQDFRAGGLLLMLVPVGPVVLLVMAVRPVLTAIAVLGFAFINPSLLPTLTEFGSLSVRYVDIPFWVLTVAVGMRIAAVKPQNFFPYEFKELFVPLVPFLIYIGASLANVSLSVPHFFAASAASYLRLIATAFFAPLLQMATRDSSDIKVFHKALIVFGVASVAIGAWEAWSGLEVDESERFKGRFGGLLGPNSFGIVAGLLVLYAFAKKGERTSSILWVALLALGLLGLFLAKSASSIFATAGAVAVYMAALRPRRGSIPGLFTWVTIVTAMTIVATLAVWNLRQSDVLGFFNISGGSFAQRFMIAHAGLQIFLDHPLIGVGWQSSATESFIGHPALNVALMEKFPRLPTHYFFSKKTTSLHNMYVQILAELGIVGFALFAYACIRIGKAATRMVRNIPAESPYKVWARFYVLGLLFLLIWWNTNPLFGGQIETILAFTFLAALATVADFDRHRARLDISDTSDNGSTR